MKLPVFFCSDISPVVHIEIMGNLVQLFIPAVQNIESAEPVVDFMYIVYIHLLSALLIMIKTTTMIIIATTVLLLSIGYILSKIHRVASLYYL